MFDWRELFIPIILNRGEKLPRGNISNVKISEQGLTAQIQGTEVYDLQINTGLDWISCSCPFAQNNGLACKHLAALFVYCEENWTNEMLVFFKNAENSRLGQQAIKYKIKRLEEELEKEREKLQDFETGGLVLENNQEWIRTDPQYQIKREEKARLVEERKKQKQVKEEEKRRKREERQRKYWEKIYKEEEERKRLQEERQFAEERAKKRIEEREAQRKKEQEEMECFRRALEERKERERERLAIEAEEKRQEKLDKKTARKMRRLPKRIQDKFKDDDEFIKMLEEAEREPRISDLSSDEEDLYRLKETGWYYDDVDKQEGYYCIDTDGKKIFILKGFH